MTGRLLLVLLALVGLAAPSPAPPDLTVRKFHPGHYAALLRTNDSVTDMARARVPGLAGYLKRYTWRSLEPAKGLYTFTELEADLAWSAARGLRLVVMIEDKTFVDEMPLPDYLVGYVRRNNPGGYTAVRWEPVVVERYRALLSALARFDAHPALEGVATQETAPGFDAATLTATGYTPEKYRDALTAVLLHGARALPHSRVFFTMNYLPQRQSYLGEIADAIAAHGGVMGGPDLLPESEAHQAMYTLYRERAAQQPMQVHVMNESYAHPKGDGSGYWTMAELARYARTLSIDYLFWTVEGRDVAYGWPDAVPVIANDPLYR